MRYIYGIFLISVITVLAGCSRRPLEEEVGVIAQIEIKIDWSKSNLKIEEMHRATVRVFPHDGSPAYDFRMQENLEQDVIPLALGKYSIIVFNETTDDEDWKSLVFVGAEKYNDFVVTTRSEPFMGLFTKIDEVISRKTPEALASWSIDEFEVTEDMIRYTRALSKGDITKAQFAPEAMKGIQNQLTKLTTITPLPVVKNLNIVARVQNLNSAQRASGAIPGATGAIQLSTRKPFGDKVTHIFPLNGRKYDNPDKPKDGTIGANILIFDVSHVDHLQYDLLLDFLLHDGSQAPTESFDITQDVLSGEVDINVNVGFEVDGRPDDKPIVLPPSSIGDQEPKVEDWEEVVVPLGNK